MAQQHPTTVQFSSFQVITYPDNIQIHIRVFFFTTEPCSPSLVHPGSFVTLPRLGRQLSTNFIQWFGPPNFSIGLMA
jgi:hypothetical protein